MNVEKRRDEGRPGHPPGQLPTQPGYQGQPGDEWDILDVYFRDHMYAFTKHHHDSYKQFLKTYIPETIRSFNPVTMIKLDESGNEKVKVEVYVGGETGQGIYLDRPTILDNEGKPMLLSPLDARLRNLTYSTKLYADIEIVYSKDGRFHSKREFPHTLIGAIPLMLHSDQCMLHGQGSKVVRALGECPMDPGGYFIVDGKEKVIISQERITTNRLFVSVLDQDSDQDFNIRGYIRCTGDSGETKLSPRTVEFKVVRTACFLDAVTHSSAESDAPDGDRCYNMRVTHKYQDKQGAILMSLPSINGMLPMTTVFRAFGVESDKDIIEMICGKVEDAPVEFLNFLRPSLVHGAAEDVFTMEQAHENLQKRTFYKSAQQLKSILVQDVFPNIESSQHPTKQKAMYLGYLVSVIMKTSLGILQPSDRDSYVFKRVDMSGILLAQLFQETYGKFRKQIRNVLDQEYNYGPVKNDGKIERLVDNYNLHKVFPSGTISDVFAKSLKGMWGPPTDDPEQGLVQDLSRISYIGFLSHLRRVNMPLDRSIKITSPHRLHSQQWGIMCPFESPDGASIGYLKNFALMTHICSGSDPKVVVAVLQELQQEPEMQLHLLQDTNVSHVVAAKKDTVKIFINGTWYGITANPNILARTIRLYRRCGLINSFISVSWNIHEGEIRIQTEPGRPCRPLLLVEDGQVLLFDGSTNTNTNTKPALSKQELTKQTWFDLLFGSLLPAKSKTEALYNKDEFVSPYSVPDLAGKSHKQILAALEKKQGVIEYLDIEEENTMLVAMNCLGEAATNTIGIFHTHAEIHPSTAFSVVTHNVPFANHNQGPRIIFHAAQSKQALGVYATNFTKRFDTNGYIQHYPQKRLVTTRGAHYNGCDRMPNGANVIVAVATYSGYNQEDSIIINKNSVDRGLFHITGYKTMVATEKTISVNERLMFANPIEMREAGQSIEGVKHANYTLLNKEGIVKENAYIPRGQDAIVLGMVHVKERVKEVQRGVLMYKTTEEKYKDVSLKTDVHHYGRVDRVFLGTPTPGGNNANRICKIKFRKVRRPELGDKHSSSHGQKGVIGMIIPQENMPFTKDGIVPDLIINPHAFPSRMTIGHLVETVMSKVCCLEGMTGDGTVFIPFDKEELYDQLEKRQFQRHGNEIMYNGRTGEQIHSEIFLGPIYYYRLKHMVADKIHSRSIGAKTQLTHQPTSGRSAGGGLRIGEMERDVLLGHGLSQFAKECMMEKSDKFRWAVCRRCGTVATFSPEMKLVECNACKTQDVSVVETPYSLKLLIQELEGMGVQMRLSADPIQDPNASSSDSDSSSDSSSESSSSDEDKDGDEEDEEDEEEEEEEEEIAQADLLDDEAEATHQYAGAIETDSDGEESVPESTNSIDVDIDESDIKVFGTESIANIPTTHDGEEKELNLFDGGCDEQLEAVGGGTVGGDWPGAETSAATYSMVSPSGIDTTPQSDIKVIHIGGSGNSGNNNKRIYNINENSQTNNSAKEYKDDDMYDDEDDGFFKDDESYDDYE